MKDNQAKYPQLRFKGFTDPWEQRKLGEIFLERKSRSSDGELISVTIKTGVVKANDLNRRDNSSFDKSNYKTVQKGDIAYNSMRMWQGASGYSPFNGILSPAYTVLKPKSYDVNSEFFAYMFKKKPMLQCFQRSSQGLTSDTWNLKYPALSSIQVKVPSVEEQIKIAGLFKKVDHLIALHQRKLAMLKELKQGYLQKLFPQNGSKFPQLRFAGFADAWEPRKLGDVANIVGGGTPSTSILEYWNGNIDWYAPAEIGEQRYVSKSQKTITELGLKKSSATILPVGTILFTSRAGIGKTAILASRAATNQGFQSIVPRTEMLNSYFIFSETSKLKKYGEITGAGSTFVEVSGKQMEKMPILLPILKEQEIIGKFFKQLDKLIAANQRKVEKLKELKKGYMQKMFC